LAFEERFGMLVDQQWLWKENRALAHRLRSARLKERGVMEDIDYQHPRGLDRKLMRTLANSEWVRQHQNILLLGPERPGSGAVCVLFHDQIADGLQRLPEISVAKKPGAHLLQPRVNDFFGRAKEGRNRNVLQDVLLDGEYLYTSSKSLYRTLGPQNIRQSGRRSSCRAGLSNESR